MSQVQEYAKEKVACKLCGKPSITVICMHCFLNYNYKMYAQTDEDMIDFQAKEEKEELAEGLEKLVTIAKGNDVMDCQEDRSRHDHRKNGTDDHDVFHHFSLKSIMERLPKFE